MERGCGGDVEGWLYDREECEIASMGIGSRR